MEKKGTNIEFIDQKTEKKEDRKARLSDVLNGTLLTRDKVVRQLPYALFLTFLLILYIGNRYHAEKITRQTVKLQTEIQELRAKAITTASELEYMSSQSQVARLVEEKNLGLKQSEIPPYKIIKRKRKYR